MGLRDGVFFHFAPRGPRGLLRRWLRTFDKCFSPHSGERASKAGDNRHRSEIRNVYDTMERPKFRSALIMIASGCLRRPGYEHLSLS